MKTKIFCDIAELNLIKKFNKKKIVQGFTTNPSLMRKAGAKDYKIYSKQILKACKKKPVSLEQMKEEKSFKDWELLRIGRLSVMPVPKNIWNKIIKLSQ